MLDLELLTDKRLSNSRHSDSILKPSGEKAAIRLYLLMPGLTQVCGSGSAQNLFKKLTFIIFEK
jgi:hypothetical protein